jgi:hypothetical protein
MLGCCDQNSGDSFMKAFEIALIMTLFIPQPPPHFKVNNYSNHIQYDILDGKANPSHPVPVFATNDS